MKGPLTAMEGFYGMDAAETFFFVVENAVTVYGLHFHPLSAAHGVGGEEIFQRKLQEGRDALLLLRAQRDRALPLTTKPTPLALKELLRHSPPILSRRHILRHVEGRI